MVICVNTYQVKKGQRDALVEELRRSGIEDALRKMEGNVCFNFSVPIREPDVFYLTDIWEDKASFQAHLESQATAAWSALKEQYVADSQVRRYDL